MSHCNSSVYLCLINQDKIWLIQQNLPQLSIEKIRQFGLNSRQIGEFDGQAVHLAILPTNDGENSRLSSEEHIPFPEDDFASVRALMHLPEPLFYLAAKAMQLAHHQQSCLFCAKCGGDNHVVETLNAMQCSRCEQIHYPMISPCVIVAIRREGKVLLAQHHRHPANFYGVVAGFVEVGESLEQCVMREINEEVGLTVQNVQYVSSQPWPFPSNLMLGFIADWQAGDIRLEKEELAHADWFDSNNLPDIPPQGTIARALIEQALAQ